MKWLKWTRASAPANVQTVNKAYRNSFIKFTLLILLQLIMTSPSILKYARDGEKSTLCVTPEMYNNGRQSLINVLCHWCFLFSISFLGYLPAGLITLYYTYVELIFVLFCFIFSIFRSYIFILNNRDCDQNRNIFDLIK